VPVQTVFLDAGGVLVNTAAALAEPHTYHQTFNLWETVPDGVGPSLAALRRRGFRLVVVSNANGTLPVARCVAGEADSWSASFGRAVRSRYTAACSFHALEPSLRLR
jgi:FMN phosphatase YigB (HAD superfamily)